MAIGRIGAAKIALFIVALVPLARLVAGALVWQEWLGANPAEFIVRSTGDWTLRILLATLAVTPLRRWTGWHWLTSSTNWRENASNMASSKGNRLAKSLKNG